MKRKQNIRWNTMKILVIGFLSVIVLGAVLLWLPVSNEKPISFLDALFTSTTSVCVTGLVTVVPKYQFTIMGKIILLILIQIGGLGIIACITAFFMLLKRKITVKERIVIQEAYNMNSLGGLVGMVRRILFGTVVVEGIGAVFYAIQFSRDYGLVKGIWYGVFHSVSAFCNAGIDILGEDSLARYVTSPLINITTMMLIILGGIGFTVWYDVIDNGKKIWHREIPKKWCFTRLKLHSKIAIVTTLILLIAGTLLNFVLEYRNPETIGNLNTGQKIMASAFQAVTTRTAGFSTFQQSGMHEETGFLNIILMFIGGSPGGTAGGLKTTTFALLFLAFHTMLRGGHDIECFQRKVAEDSFRVAFVTFMLALGIYVTGTTVIAVIEPDTISLQKIMYETGICDGNSWPDTRSDNSSEGRKQDCVDDTDVCRTSRTDDHCVIICRKGKFAGKDADTSDGKDYDWLMRRSNYEETICSIWSGQFWGKYCVRITKTRMRGRSSR